MSFKNIIFCSNFQKINSNSKGVIISSNQGEIDVEYSKFIEITSSSFPGVLYSNNCDKITLKKSTYSLCYATGNNLNYGRILYAYTTKIIANNIAAEYCSPKTSNVGDSTIATSFCTIDQFSFVNFSFCYGSDGSSSVSLNNNKEDSVLSYLNIMNGIDHNSFESLNSDESCQIILEFSNIINSTYNFDASLNCNHNNLLVKSCIFQQISQKKFNSAPNKIQLFETICDQQVEGYSFKQIIQQTSLTFKVQIYSTCSLNTLNENKENSILLHSISLFSIIVS